MKLKQKLAINYIRARLHILALVSLDKAVNKALSLFCTPRQKNRKKGSPIFEKGERLSFRLETLTIRGHRWLPHQASGPTLKKVLIVHGFESASVNFEGYIQGFLKKGVEVLAFDAPAHGGSDGKKITLPLYINMLRAVYDKYGPIQSFLGHSFGGIALSLFLESLHGNADTKLVLIAPAVEMSTAIDGFFQLLQLRDELRSGFDKRIEEIGGHPPSWFSVRRAMQGIRAGVLWVQDEEDLVTPWKDALPVKEDGHPNIRFHLTKGLGHRKIYRDPAVVQEILEFL